jgi:hypothetical protein
MPTFQFQTIMCLDRSLVTLGMAVANRRHATIPLTIVTGIVA